MHHSTKALLNGVLASAISVTAILTMADDSDGPWDRSDLAGAAGISAFLSGTLASAAATSPAVESGLQSQL
jgi:hypothetical protein